MRITKENSACLIIDIQEKLFPVMSGKEQLLKNCITLIRGMQILGIPLFVTQQYTKGLGATIPEIAAEIPDFTFFEKRDFSCCGEPPLTELLKRNNTRFVILSGIETHVCVLQTAIDLKEEGFIPVVAADAVSSRFELHKNVAFDRFRQEGIIMSTAESLLFELTRSSAAPEFREISRLVK